MLLLLLGGAAVAAPTLRAGLLGEFLLHPGAFIAIGSTPDSDARLVPLVGGRAGGYVHPGHHTAAFVHGEAGLRRQGKAIDADLMLGAGLHHRWLPTRVTVRDGDALNTVVDAGRANVMGLLGLRLADADGAIRPFGRVDAWFRGPVNRGVRTELVVALGVAFGGTP